MDEIQFPYIHKKFYQLHIMLATEYGKTWDLIKESIDEKLEDDFARNIKPLMKN